MSLKPVDKDPAAPKPRNGAQAIMETLEGAGVDLMFGYSGGGTGVLIDEIVNCGIKEMNARSELSSTWMSYAYNRIKGYAASGCLYHCVGTLHCVPAIYAAKQDSAPLLVMGVSLDSVVDFREPLQDSSAMHACLTPVSKYSAKVVSSHDTPLAVRQALISANTGRPGPSSLDIAHQGLTGLSKTPAEPLTVATKPQAPDEAIAKVLDMVKDAKRPVIFVGAGIHLGQAYDELQAVAEALQIPIVSTSWGGRGTIGDGHPLFAGVAGSFGWDSGNEILQRADLWIAVGTTFSQMTTGAWNIEKPQSVVHVDIDANQIGKIFQPTLGIQADSKAFLQQVLNRIEIDGVEPVTEGREDLKEVPELKAKWYDYYNNVLCAEPGPENEINQYYVIRELSKSCPDGTIAVGDSGGHAYMLQRTFDYRVATPTALGSRYMSLGAGLPAAIGAKLACPERTVICYHGDGGFYYDAIELSTLAERGIKVIVVIDNNRCLLANRQGMKMMGMLNPWCELPETTDFVGLANSLGLPGEKVTKAEDLADAFKRAHESETSYVVDVWTDPTTRTRRSIKNVIPILSDRKPMQSAARHINPPLDGSWPA